MRLLVTHRLRRTRREGYVERTEVLEGEEIRLGRGSDAELHLPDARVLLHHATLTVEGGTIVVRADPRAEIELDGIPVDSAHLTDGHTVAVGPYDLTWVAERGDCDGALTIELARPMGDAETLVRARVRTPLLSRRRSGWALGGLVALVLLVIGVGVPVGSFVGEPQVQRQATEAGDAAIIRQAETLWVTEQLSDVHHNLEAGCQACHLEPFATVTETSCLACHDTLAAHVGPHATFAADVNMEEGCASCHQEHKGANGIFPTAAVTEDGCIACHSKDIAPGNGGKLAKVASIAQHPAILYPPAPASDLKFSHASHLVPEGKRGPTGAREKLGCADCHQSANAGRDMTVPSFEEGCQSCHTLAFASEDPGRRLPHGSPTKVRLAVTKFYEALAAGQIDVPAFEAPVRRRRPGQEARPQLVAPPEPVPVSVRIEQAMAGPAVKGQCATCHTLTDSAYPVQWGVAPVRFEHDWITRAAFSHEDHRKDAKCTTCHADAVKSEKVSDVSLPAIGTCLECHGSAFEAPKVESTCVTCHEYHGTTNTNAALPDDVTHRFAGRSTGNEAVLSDQLGRYLAEVRN